jgi:hypothetical protein
LQGTVGGEEEGLPDWWEDRNGYDKWDPSDAVRFAQSASGNVSGNEADRSSTSFAQWRAAYFPGDVTALGEFARQDSDGDGIPHLLEYAFLLSPVRVDTELAHLPRIEVREDRFVLSFRKRKGASDLEYHLERSEDAMTWIRVLPGEIDELSLSQEEIADHRVVIRDRPLPESGSHGFMRIRVELKD